VEVEVGTWSACLIVQSPGGQSVVPLDDRAVSVGRGTDNDIVIDDPRASRKHLVVEPRPGGYRVIDSGSQNGTIRNGRRIRSAPLHCGDVISVGQTRIRFDMTGSRPDTQSSDAITQGAERPRVAPSSADVISRFRSVAVVTRALNCAVQSETLFDDIIDAAVEITGSERGFLILSGPDGMAFAAARNYDREQTPRPEFEVSWSIAIQVGSRGEPVLAVNASEDARFSKLESVENLGLRSVLCVPVRGNKGIAGVIYTDNRLELGAYSADDQSVLEVFADQVGIALSNRELIATLSAQKEQVDELNAELQGELRQRQRFSGPTPGTSGHQPCPLLGGSARMDELRHLLEKVAATDFPVLVQGESGTGKELVARHVHARSRRADRPFVAVNCAAIPETLLEGEFFGHVRGAFTGADQDKEGLFALADGGTLFMDEVSEMSPGLQSRLLRALQEKEIRPVGAKEVQSVDVRLIAASNRDLARMSQRGEFREDLYYRLRVLPVVAPALRDRKEDIPELLRHFLGRYAADDAPPSISTDAMDTLCAYGWPGNVRELENEVKRLAVLSGPVVERADLSRNILEAGEMLVGHESDHDSLVGLVESIETREITNAMERCAGNKTRAAKLLGITRFTLQRKLEKYGIGQD